MARQQYDECCIFCTILIISLVGGFIASVGFATRFVVELVTFVLSPLHGYELPSGYTEQISWQLLATFVFVVVAAIMMDRYVPPLVSTWPCIDVKPVDGEELASLQVEFEAATAAHRDKYRSFGIKLVSAHRVVNFQLQEGFDARRAVLRGKGKSDAVSRLYHGTTSAAAKAIIQHGFALPRRGGMFGKGIYFADTPLKSLQYTRGRNGVMLCCDVALGNSMIKRMADNQLEAESTSFKRGFLPRLFGQKSFDSVTAATGTFGAVRVPEYVVYNGSQAVPRYVLIVESKRG